jgi:hypothetical protein
MVIPLKYLRRKKMANFIKTTLPLKSIISQSSKCFDTKSGETLKKGMDQIEYILVR